MKDLTTLKCKACEGWMKPLTKGEYTPLLKQILDWEIVEEIKIIKNFKFTNFKEALAFVNKVGEIAESENHHPNIFLFGWNKVKITLTTHALKGLSENDFIIAAKIDAIEQV